MAVLTVVMPGGRQEIQFEGTPTVSQLLLERGIIVPHPCGGHGTCRKCVLPVEGAVSPATAEEARLPAGMRLSCMTHLLGDTTVWLEQAQMTHIQHEGLLPQFAYSPLPGRIGAAVDVGTTTLAVRLLDLASGQVLGSKSCENPQRAIASDVIARMERAMDGRQEALQRAVVQAVKDMIAELCAENSVPCADVTVVTGNTTMLYLYTGRSPEALSHAPFEADCLFDLWEDTVYFPPCMSAFVGADITCAVLASGMTEKEETALLIDVGTNGEIALWRDGKLLVSATAAGPAFEGGGISSGCGSVPGAVDKVWVEDGSIHCTTIGGAAPVGMCGSGIIDAMAALLELEWVDETGAADEEEMIIAGGVALTDRDVRSIQLAKGAIAAGIRTLMEEHGVTVDDIDRLYLAGGFGAHLNLESAARIGLIPEALIGKTVVLGNAALSGAHMLLMNKSFADSARGIAGRACTVNLGGNSAFTNNFMECMLFE